MKFFFLLLIVTLPHARAQDLERQIESIGQSLDTGGSHSLGQQWPGEVIRIRTTLELGIEIPLVSKFSINPEVEFYFSNK